MKKILFIALASFSLLISNGCKKKKSETPADMLFGKIKKHL